MTEDKLSFSSEGAKLTPKVIEEAVNAIAQNYGTPTHIFISPFSFWCMYWMMLFDNTCRGTGFRLEYDLSAQEYNKYNNQIAEKRLTKVKNRGILIEPRKHARETTVAKTKLVKGAIADGNKIGKGLGDVGGIWILQKLVETGPEGKRFECQNIITGESNTWWFSEKSIIRPAGPEAQKFSKSSLKKHLGNVDLFTFLVKKGACEEEAARYAKIKNPKSASRLALKNDHTEFYKQVAKKFPAYRLPDSVVEKYI